MGWEVKKILQENTTTDNFGISVAIYGNYAIVSANGASARKAYLYLRKNNGKWVKVSEQDNPIAKGNDFGDAVGLYGNYAIVGGDSNGSGNGMAAIYQRMY